MKNILTYCLLLLTSSLFAQDQYEPNENNEQATPLPFNQVFTASLHTRSDVDVFEIETMGSGLVLARVFDISSEYPVSIELFTANGEQIANSNGGTASNPALMDGLVCAAGKYYLRIVRGSSNPGDSDGTYKIEVSFDDFDVYECNNTFSTATPIELGITLQAQLYNGTNNDPDYYQFQVPAGGGVLNANLTIPAGVAYEVVLYDSNENEVDSDGGTVSNPAVISTRLCEGGLFYLLMRRNSSNTTDNINPYELAVTLETEDTNECNDAFSQATEITSCAPINGSINPDGEFDWYKIQVDALANYNVRLRNVPATMRLRLEVSNADGEVLESERSEEEGLPVVVNFTPAEVGFYYFKVSSVNENIASTDLYELTTDIPCDNIQVEICDNGQDDNGDELVDCDDPECATFSSCIDNNCTLTADLESTPATCETNTGSITVTARGGTPPYTYVKDGVAQDNGTFMNLAAGPYAITIQDSGDCEVERTGILGDDCNDGGGADTPQLIVGEVVGAAGTQVDIPISIRGCERIGSLQGSFGFEDLSIVRVDEFVEGAIAVNGNTDSNIVRFTFFDDGQGDGVPVNDDDILFYVRVTLLGSEGATTAVSLVNDPLMIQLSCGDNANLPSVVTPELVAGMVTIVNTYVIAGQITDPNGNGINNVTVNLIAPNRTEAFNTLTDANGNYRFGEVPAGLDWEITPRKDLNPQNGVSSFGLFLINRAILLGLNTPQINSPYQLIAADADCNTDTNPAVVDDNITALDLLTIQQVLAETRAEFPCSSASWRFVEAIHPISGLNTPDLFGFEGEILINALATDQQIDFTGVKIGDILGDADPQNFGGNDPLDFRTEQVLELISTTTATERPDEFWLELTPTTDQQLLSYQLALDFPTDALELLQVTTSDNTTNILWATQPNRVQLNWFSPTGEEQHFSAADPLLRFRFRTTSAVNRSADQFAVSTEPLAVQSVAYDATYRPLKLAVRSATSPQSSAMNLQLFPNPVRDQLHVQWINPTEAVVKITIYDLLGRPVYQRDGSTNQGNNTLTLDTANWESGMYYINCTTPEQQQGSYFAVNPTQ